MRTIDFYRLPNGQSPIEIFLDNLTGKQAQKILWVLQLIEELETIPRQYFKKLVDSEGIWEVRIQFGNDIFRLLGFFDDGTLLILTNGFAKKRKRRHRRKLPWLSAVRMSTWQGEKRHERC